MRQICPGTVVLSRCGRNYLEMSHTRAEILGPAECMCQAPGTLEAVGDVINYHSVIR